MSSSQATIRLVTLSQADYTLYFIPFQYYPGNAWFLVGGGQPFQVFEIDKLDTTTTPPMWKQFTSGRALAQGLGLAGDYGTQSAVSLPGTYRVCWIGTGGAPNNCSGQLGVTGPPPPPPTKNRYTWDGIICQPDPMGEYTTLADCQAAHPTGGTGTPPPPGGTSFPSPPNSVNPIDWLNWLGQILQWAFTNLWNGIAAALQPLIDYLVISLITLWNTLFTDWTTFWTNWTTFWTDATLWFGNLLVGLVKSGSPSILETFSTAVTSMITSIRNAIQGFTDPTMKIGTDPVTAVQQLGAQIGDMISQPSNPDSVQERVTELDGLVTKIFLALFTSQQIVEDIPALNKTGTSQFTLSWLEARGIFQVIRGVLEPYLQHNINRNLDYKLNQQYQNVIPGLGELSTLLAQGRIAQSVYDLLAPQVSGIRSDYLGLIHLMSQRVPSLQEIIIYNRRHGSGTYDISQLGDLLGVDMARYGPVFLENEYRDPSLIAARTLSRLGILQPGDIASLVTRMGFRKDLLPGQTISDYDLMVKYFSMQLGPTLLKSLLASEEKLFVEGKATLDQLTTVAKRVYSDATELQDYLQYAQNEEKAKSTKSAVGKHFTYTQLIKFAEAGVNVSTFMDADLTAEGWDSTHKTTIEAYITAVLSGKGTTISGGPVA